MTGLVTGYGNQGGNDANSGWRRNPPLSSFEPDQLAPEEWARQIEILVPRPPEIMTLLSPRGRRVSMPQAQSDQAHETTMHLDPHFDYNLIDEAQVRSLGNGVTFQPIETPFFTQYSYSAPIELIGRVELRWRQHWRWDQRFFAQPIQLRHWEDEPYETQFHVVRAFLGRSPLLHPGDVVIGRGTAMSERLLNRYRYC